MRVLTLIRPWDQALIHLSKDVENRRIAFPEKLLGEDIAIHAGQKWDVEGAVLIEQLTGVVYKPSDCTPGVITGVVRLIGLLRQNLWGQADIVLSTDEELDRVAYTGTTSPWFGGPYGWVRGNPRPLKRPVPWRGRQGLQRLDADTHRQVIEALEVTEDA